MSCPGIRHDFGAASTVRHSVIVMIILSLLMGVIMGIEIVELGVSNFHMSTDAPSSSHVEPIQAADHVPSRSPSIHSQLATEARRYADLTSPIQHLRMLSSSSGPNTYSICVRVSYPLRLKLFLSNPYARLVGQS